MGLYDRNRQRWTFKGKTKETSYLLKLVTKGDNSSLSILNKIRTRKWNSAPPNSRSTSKNQETVEESWQEIPDFPSSTPPSSPRNRPRDTPDWHKLICNDTRRPKRDEEGDTEPESELETSETEVRAIPPPQGRENRQEVFNLLYALHSDPQGQEATREFFFDDLEKKCPGNLASAGRTIIRRIINNTNNPDPDNQSVGDVRVWIQQLLEKTRDQTPRKKATISTHNLGPVGITLSMDVIEDTLALGPYVTCFQDIYYTDKTSTASREVSLAMLHKGVFNIHQCTKHEWRSGKDRRSQLARGRVLWIKATTITGKKVNIINVYQATSQNHEQQEKLYDTLSKALGPTTDPCILIGDVNASILGGRINYAPPSDDNPTTIADRTFANFVETTQGRIFPPDQDSWKKPFGGIKGKKAKLDFAVVYNLDEEVSEGYTDWMSPLHDHARVSFAIGDSIWGNIPEPRLTPSPKEDKPKTRLKMEDIVPHLATVNEICFPLAA